MIEIQGAIISKIKASILTNVYSYVPEKTDPPYIVVSFPELDENDTDTEEGFISTVQITSTSRYRGYKEISDINKELYSLLHRTAMDDTDEYAFSTIQQEFSSILTDDDGLTRVSVQRFSVIFEPKTV